MKYPFNKLVMRVFKLEKWTFYVSFKCSSNCFANVSKLEVWLNEVDYCTNMFIGKPITVIELSANNQLFPFEWF